MKRFEAVVVIGRSGRQLHAVRPSLWRLPNWRLDPTLAFPLTPKKDQSLRIRAEQSSVNDRRERPITRAGGIHNRSTSIAHPDDRSLLAGQPKPPSPAAREGFPLPSPGGVPAFLPVHRTWVERQRIIGPIGLSGRLHRISRMKKDRSLTSMLATPSSVVLFPPSSAPRKGNRTPAEHANTSRTPRR